MRYGYSDTCLAHEPGERHPDSPDRLRAIRRKLSRKHEVEFVDAAAASVDAVKAVHDDEYVDDVESFCAEGGGRWDPDTVAVEETWDAALTAAGMAQWAAREAFDASARQTTFALGRPPGHHALVDDAMGFCFFNNVAVATEHVLDEGLASRVAIFDWDVHHGNGTQDIFYDRGDVFYASIHEAGLYPGTGEMEETGTGEGAGTTLNVPLSGGAGDAEYRHVLESAIEPAVDRFDPDLVLVSAGFDAHKHDPISRMHLTTEGYGWLTARVRALVDRLDASVGFVLEGGYSLDTLADGVAIVHDIFDGREPVTPEDSPDEDVVDLVDTVRTRHSLG